MGNARWDPTDWATYSSNTQQKTQTQIFRSSGLSSDLDPKGFKVRESVDSPANPRSTPIILACDETGSMGYLATAIIKKDLGVIMKEIYDRQPVTDPHIMCMAVGDAYSDHSPIQMTQFEAAVDPLTEQVEKIYLEGNGGGNGGESYNLAWYGAAFRTSVDAFKKKRSKGYLFTIGDEPPHLNLEKSRIKQHFGDDVETDFTSRGLLDVLTPNWEVFHLMVGAYKSNYGAKTENLWRELLGERAIAVGDHEKLGEIIVSTIQVVEGATVDSVVNSWSGDTSIAVQSAIKSLSSKRAMPGKKASTSAGIVTF